MGNVNEGLHRARANKKDEFYTQLSDIANELKHYTKHFKGKTVLCNCDDPRVSNFFQYFALKFNDLGLKKLIAVCYKNNQPDLFSQNDCEQAVYLEYYGESEDMCIPDFTKVHIKPLQGDGDFRSMECIEFLKEADIVVTNPPFSLFREYVAQLIKYDKKFIIVGHQNAITYREIFPLLKDNKMWLGYGFKGGAAYFLNDTYENYAAAGQKKEGMIRVSGVVWFTNLEIPKTNEEIILYKTYKPEEYPKYDNYDAIEVGKTELIPIDYDGVMGVPVTFLNKYCPKQFEIVGCADADVLPKGWRGMSKDFVDLYYAQGNTGAYSEGNRLAALVDKDGKAKVPFKRVLIRKRK